MKFVHPPYTVNDSYFSSTVHYYHKYYYWLKTNGWQNTYGRCSLPGACVLLEMWWGHILPGHRHPWDQTEVGRPWSDLSISLLVGLKGHLHPQHWPWYDETVAGERDTSPYIRLWRIWSYKPVIQLYTWPINISSLKLGKNKIWERKRKVSLKRMKSIKGTCKYYFINFLKCSLGLTIKKYLCTGNTFMIDGKNKVQ